MVRYLTDPDNQNMDSRAQDQWHRLIHPMVCGIFPDQGSNQCSLHWQVRKSRQEVLLMLLEQGLIFHDIESKACPVLLVLLAPSGNDEYKAEGHER
ncbi:serine/threonine-protein phosphatase 4 regulatory subunit 1-like isoform X2 [Bos mutus]|uniref:serine/threonine-protein phosphatase 4 regulatory subunit 1-like isoform X2 n=1 Tax=Bos mutus TaxID=72004 RepID=UPI0038B680E9